jgi:hypothetical protein
MASGAGSTSALSRDHSIHIDRNGLLTIAFLPEAAYGASLNCVALAQELRELGHRPVFLCDPGFAGMFGNYGFDELPVAMSPLKSDAEIADFWQRFIDQHRPHFHLSPLEQIATYEVGLERDRGQRHPCRAGPAQRSPSCGPTSSASTMSCCSRSSRPPACPGCALFPRARPAAGPRGPAPTPPAVPR